MLKFIKNMQKRRINIISIFLMFCEIVISIDVGFELRGILEGFSSSSEPGIAYYQRSKNHKEVKD